MTTPDTFDERARTITKSLLADAARVPSRLPGERRASAAWKTITVFAVTVLVISGAVVAGASIALRNNSVAKPVPTSHPGHWKSFQLPPTGSSLDAVSCPDAGYCVAVDYTGDVFVSTNPGGGASAWKVANVDPYTTLPPGGSESTTGVSCADRSLCVAVDQQGDVITSTNPGGGAGAWTLSGVDGDAVLSGIACPDEHLCVAVGGFEPILDQNGLVMTSTNPAGGPGTWTATELHAAFGLTAVSCPSASLCVATDGSGDIVTSTNPTGGARAWSVARVSAPSDAFSAISCPSAFLCVAVDYTGNVLTSTDPTGGAGAWTITNISADITGLPMFDSVSCASERFCVFGAESNSVFMSIDPTGGSSAWIPVRVIQQGQEAMFGLSCPTSAFCVGVDGGGGAHIYTNPAT